MQNNNFNLILAVTLALGIIFGWQYFYEKPRLQDLQKKHEIYNKQISSIKKAQLNNLAAEEELNVIVPKIAINTTQLEGSISLKGLRFDDLVLKGYKQTTDVNSQDVVLLSAANTNNSYFAEFGFYGEAKDDLPNNSTIWTADKSELRVNEEMNFTWQNKNNVKFIVTIMVDDNYMFKITQRVFNGSDAAFDFNIYGLFSKYQPKETENSIVYVGPIAVIDEKLVENSYEKIRSDKSKVLNNTNLGWLGFTEKYWLCAFIPDKTLKYDVNMRYTVRGGNDQYQLDFLSPTQTLLKSEMYEAQHQMFLGAKKVKLLDDYEKEYNIHLFDRAIDFGWFYILTKPLFYALNFFYTLVGNFGVSILIVTILVKVAMFTLSNKSYKTMSKMKSLQPELERIRDLYKDDQMKINQETMALYKKMKINPITGCLPILLQIPVFFSIYKVLNVTIEMRQAPFFGWIKDLSSSDPTNIFTLFGLIPWTTPSFMHIGLWPIIMAVTMYVQQKYNPPAQDPVQQKVMQFMPLFFLFMFSNFPAGLLIYWAWNNILSILQQMYVNKSLSRK
jgi:YidC/Oxa1 family membrane protein insertase